MSRKNPDIDELGKNKFRLILFNKADLASEKGNAMWTKYFEEKGYFVVKINSRSGAGMKQISATIMEACKEKIERDRKRGILNRPIRAMVVGIPNVGKSTFINSFAGRAAAKTGNKPGVTKGAQWIRLNKQVELLDTPGILWPKFEDQAVGVKLAMLGSVNDEILNIDELSMELIKLLDEYFPEVISERYQIEKQEEPLKVLEEIARVRACLLKGNELDISKAAKIIKDDFRSGRLGKLTLEFPPVSE